VAVVAQQSTASAETAAASDKASVEEISANAQSLTHVANKLKEAITKFKLS